MTHPDAETLAAFVDGRLSGAERNRVVEHLAACDRCHEVVTDTVHLLRDPALAEDEEEDISPAVTPGKVLRPPAGRFRRALPLAAALAAAALVALLVWTPAGEWILNPLFPTAGTVADLTNPLPLDDATRTAVGTVERHWPTYLGPDDGMTHAAATAFRLGVRNAELGVALAADAGSVGEYTREVLSLLAEVEFSAHIASLYEPGPTPARLAEADGKLAELLGRDTPWYALGRWAGVARLAADTGHTGWFARPAPRRTLRSLRRNDWPPDVAGRLDAVDALADGGVDANERASLAMELAELIRVASGE